MSLGLLIVLLVFAIGFIAVAVGLKTKAGSEIGEHPIDGTGRADGSAAPLAEGSAEAAADEGGRDPLDTHGTR